MAAEVEETEGPHKSNLLPPRGAVWKHLRIGSLRWPKQAMAFISLVEMDRSAQVAGRQCIQGNQPRLVESRRLARFVVTWAGKRRPESNALPFQHLLGIRKWLVQRRQLPSLWRTRRESIISYGVPSRPDSRNKAGQVPRHLEIRNETTTRRMPFHFSILRNQEMAGPKAETPAPSLCHPPKADSSRHDESAHTWGAQPTRLKKQGWPGSPTPGNTKRNDGPTRKPSSSFQLSSRHQRNWLALDGLGTAGTSIRKQPRQHIDTPV